MRWDRRIRLNATWGNALIALDSAIAPGQQHTFSWSVVAPAPASYNMQWQMRQAASAAWFGGTSSAAVTVSAAPAPAPAPTIMPAVLQAVMFILEDDEPTGSDASFVDQSVPAAMQLGASSTVTVRMRNTGADTWSAAVGHMLVSQNPQNNLTWGGAGVAVAGSVAPGQTATFTFQVSAPALAGNYHFQWQMAKGAGVFGSPSPDTVIGVSAPATQNGAQATGLSVPALTQGERATISVTMQNTGTSVWPANSDYMLGAQNPADNSLWGIGRVALANAVAPGQSTTFTFPITAPAAGAYTMQWQMLQGDAAWFGGFASTAVTVATAASGDGISYIHTDALGSPVAKSDSAGNIISRTSYEPYGRPAAGATPTIGFTGHVNDGDTGLVYMQQRYYHPVAGRFLSVDPVTTIGGGNFDRYGYARSNPFGFVDPDGREEEPVIPVVTITGTKTYSSSANAFAANELAWRSIAAS